VAGGHADHELYRPEGFYVNREGTLVVADSGNHRIMQWKRNASIGTMLVGGLGRGHCPKRLNRPTDVIIDESDSSLIICEWGHRRVARWFCREGIWSEETIAEDIACGGLAMDNDHSLYVSDVEKQEVRRYRRGDTTSLVVAGGNGYGYGLKQFNCPGCIYVDEDYTVYVSDSGNHRVIKWMMNADEGTVVAGGRGQGTDLAQLSCPQGVWVDESGILYVADCGNDRVMRFCRGETQGTVMVGGKGKGESADQLNSPMSLFFDRHRHLYVVDHGNDRVQRFAIEMN
jgi:hypothetical protein